MRGLKGCASGITLRVATVVLLISAVIAAPSVGAQSTTVETEFLGTIHAPLSPPADVGGNRHIYTVLQGGWMKGPKLSGQLMAPSGDWFEVMPDGSGRLDVRATVMLDDGALVYVTYGGVLAMPPASMERLQKGETLGPDDLYLMTSPTFRTASEKYAWLNHVQAVGKAVGMKAGEGGFVRYDLFFVK